MKRQLPEPNPQFACVAEDGKEVDTSVIESAGLGFDPANQTIELTKAEKLRTTALMLAINAYANLIIKDAEYLKEMHNESRREGGPVIKPATMNAMIQGAIDFEAFLLGRYSKQAQIAAEPETQETPQPEPELAAK